MPISDTSHTTKTKQKRAHTLANFHIQNPYKQISGPRGTTPASILTEIKIYQGPLEEPLQVIDIEDIAIRIITDLSQVVWDLKRNTTILANQILVVPSSYTLRVFGTTLTNNGIINVKGDIRCTHDYNVPPGLINNRGIINISADREVAFAERGYLINTGTVNNNGYIVVQSIATIINNPSATINNNVGGEIRINGLYTYTYINNAGGTITNKGAFFNSNGGAVYNNNGGIFNNTTGTYTDLEGIYIRGSFFNGIVGTCGVGIVNGTIAITAAICPP